MKRFLLVAVVVMCLVFPSLTRADCNNFSCFNDGSLDATCDITFCGGGGNCGTYYALTCRVYCDRMGSAGSCWCSAEGECMIV